MTANRGSDFLFTHLRGRMGLSEKRQNGAVMIDFYKKSVFLLTFFNNFVQKYLTVNIRGLLKLSVDVQFDDPFATLFLPLPIIQRLPLDII